MKQPSHCLKRGAIVSCYFPLNEDPDKPGPSARPALVLSAFQNKRKNSETLVIVAYGTSRKMRVNLGYEIRIEDQEARKSSCLHRPTRFTLNRMRILPLTNEFFDFNTDGTPVIGHIPVEEMRNLNTYLDKLAGHSEQLNFFRPKEALAKGLVFDPHTVDIFMRKEMTGLQRLPRDSRPRAKFLRRA